jgi:competence protein ComEC
MPAGMLALVAMPFGFDGPLWRLMGNGLDWMIMVATWVAHLPGSVGRIPAFGTGALLVCTAGLLVMCLLRTPLRWVGAALIAAACIMIACTPQPDVLVAADGDAVAVRGPDGNFAVKKITGDPFAVREWLAADADARLPDDAKLGEGFTCDAIGCVAKLPNASLLAIAQSGEAFADDCARAAVVIALRQAPPNCAAIVLSRPAWREGGALALYRRGQGWDIVATHRAGVDRPWAPAAERRAKPTIPPTPGDATPRPEDLEPDDENPIVSD